MMEQNLINRRQFITSLASFSAVIAVPTSLAASAEIPQEIHALRLPEDIAALELCLANHPGQFSWMVHNKLRHRYLSFNEWMSRQHADIILRNSPMDPYILNTLSDWHLTNNHGQLNPERAVNLLLSQVERYPNFVHMRAACLIKAADTCRELELNVEATQLYTAVLNFDSAQLSFPFTLHIYNSLAQYRLAN